MKEQKMGFFDIEPSYTVYKLQSYSFFPTVMYLNSKRANVYITLLKSFRTDKIDSYFVYWLR